MQKMYSVLSNIFEKEVVKIKFKHFSEVNEKCFPNEGYYVNLDEPIYKIYFSDNTTEEIKLSEYIFKLTEYALAWKNIQS